MVPSRPMRIVLGGALALALAGCGGDEAENAAIGTWAAQRADGCLVVFALGDDGRCAYGVICELVTDEIGAERHEGTCETAGGRIEASWERSTCDSAPALSVRYSAEGDRMTWAASNGRIAFERIEDDGEGSAVVRYGCWDGDEIVFSDLRPL
jgi:hypothetical protein